jgi:hypothetical protein
MRSNRERSVTDEHLGGKHHFVATISYMMGGTNWFHGTKFPRGYYLTAQVVERSREPGSAFSVESFILGSGFKRLLREANRFSVKALDNIEIPEGMLDELRTACVRQAELALPEKV